MVNILDMQFNNETELMNYFQAIHNFIRNRFGFYGKSALQFFNFFFVLKLIEPFLTEMQMSNDCKYSLFVAINDDEEKLRKIREIRREISMSEHVDTIFMQFPLDRFDTQKKTLSEFLKLLEPLTNDVLDRFHVFGRIYEYFLGHITGRNSGSRNGSQMEDLGQFFTSKQLIRYCIALCDPKLKENQNIPSMGDFFCGSGGFITEYIKFMIAKYPTLNWNKQMDHIYGADTDADIIKSARVDAMTLTKTFNTDNCVFSTNFRNKNTFEENIGGLTHNQERVLVDFNFTNPPYGQSGQNDESGKVKISNCNEYIKHVARSGSINILVNIYAPTKGKNAVKDAIKGDNKECCALLHGMANLTQNGVYCGVLKEGVFFDQKFKDLRKALVENYEVLYVISVPQDDFLNTSTKTSILIFKNSGIKTSSICFKELSVIKDKEHVIGFNEINPINKQIVNVFSSDNYKFDNKNNTDMIINYAELVKNEYTFNYKNYIKQNINAKQGFKIIKLGDILEYLPKSKRKAGDAIENGQYRFYTSSDKVKTCNFLDINKQLCVIFGTGGKGSLFLDDCFSCSADNFICKTNNDLLTTYIYYYVKYKWEEFISKLFNGSTLGHINKENMNNYEIPIPEDISTLEVYLSYLGPANKVLRTLQTLQTLQKEKEEEICGKIRVLTLNSNYYTEHRLGDICEIQNGKRIVKNQCENGNYPVYGGGDISFYTNNYNRDGYTCKISREGMSYATCIMLLEGKYYLNSQAFTVISNNNKLTNNNYLWYFLISIKTDILNCGKGSCQLSIDIEQFKNIQIRILKQEILDKFGLTDDFKTAELIRSQLITTFKCQEYFTKEMMKLVLDDIQDNNDINIQNNNNDINIDIEDNNIIDTENNNNIINIENNNIVEEQPMITETTTKPKIKKSTKKAK